MVGFVQKSLRSREDAIQFDCVCMLSVDRIHCVLVPAAQVQMDADPSGKLLFLFELERQIHRADPVHDINTKKMRVKLVCDKGLLDTMVDRFGTKGVIYNWIDEDHFSCEPIVELNYQFYGWVCSFGDRIKIETPEIAERFAAFLSRVRELY